MANWFVDSVGWAAVTPWAALTAYSVGDLRRQLAAPAVDSERVFRCTTAGTSLSAEPTWTLTKGGTTTEAAGPVWTEVTGNSTYNWAAPHARLKTAAVTWSAAGDTVFVGDDHAETTAAALTIAFVGTQAAPLRVYCVDRTVASPGAGDLKTTATVTTTGNSAITLSGAVEVNGVIFNSGTGAVTGLLDLNTVFGVFRNCSLRQIGTAGSSGIRIGQAPPVSVVFENTTVQFGNTSSGISPTFGASFVWRNTPNAVIGATLPAAVFHQPFTSATGRVTCIGVDFSAVTTMGLVGNGTGCKDVTYIDCKFPSGYTITNANLIANGAVSVLRSDSGATNYMHQRHTFYGSQVPETVLVRTGGASDSVTPVSWKIVTMAAATWSIPFENFPIAQRNAVTAANIALVMYGMWNAAALPNNDEVWFDTEYLGSASFPQASVASGTKANGLASGVALTADTSSWDSLVTARANSTAYSVGDIRKVASNPGRVFFCTTAGTSAGSEPAGYASAVDGGSVTDNTAVFRAGMRFKQTVTISSPQPGMVGLLRSIIRAAKLSSTFYVDPQIQLDALTYRRDIISNSTYLLEEASAAGGGCPVIGGSIVRAA